MGTLVENASAIKGYAEAIDDAIVAKGGTTEGGLANAATAIASIPSGGEVLDLDYNGDDTKILIELDELTGLTIGIKVASDVVQVDWGDSTTGQATKHNVTYHTYSDFGKYEIVISSVGEHNLFGMWWSWLENASIDTWKPIHNSIKRVYVGKMCKNIVFWGMRHLEHVVYAKDGTASTGMISYSAFSNGAQALRTLANVHGTGEAGAGGSAAYSLTKLTFDTRIASIESGQISQGNFTTVNIPDSVVSIGNKSFYGNSIVEAVIGIGISTIGSQAFLGNKTCTKLEIKATTPPTIQSNTFTNFFYTSSRIIVPAGCGDAYKAAENWTVYADIIEEAS